MTAPSPNILNITTFPSNTATTTEATTDETQQPVILSSLSFLSGLVMSTWVEQLVHCYVMSVLMWGLAIIQTNAGIRPCHTKLNFENMMMNSQFLSCFNTVMERAVLIGIQRMIYLFYNILPPNYFSLISFFTCRKTTFKLIYVRFAFISLIHDIVTLCNNMTSEGIGNQQTCHWPH